MSGSSGGSSLLSRRIKSPLPRSPSSHTLQTGVCQGSGCFRGWLDQLSAPSTRTPNPFFLKIKTRTLLWRCHGRLASVATPPNAVSEPTWGPGLAQRRPVLALRQTSSGDLTCGDGRVPSFLRETPKDM